MQKTPLSVYLEALDRGDMRAAGAAFTEDAVYIRPTAGGAGFEILEGRQAIQDAFERRGKRAYTHEVRTFAVADGHCLAEGVVVGEGITLVFTASATVRPDGLLSRYLGVSRAMSSDELAAIERTRR